MKQSDGEIHPDYPEEYVTGRVTFFGREFTVTPDVLIPRLESEGLVRRARKLLKPPGEGGMSVGQGGFTLSSPTIIIDIGCGSGIIGTSVADLADEVIFLDISPEALRVAEVNFRTYFPEKKAAFIKSDLLTAVRSAEKRVHTVEGNDNLPETIRLSDYPTNLLFLANLPYIKAEDWENMSADTRYEPQVALFGGEKTGFEMYERLFEQLLLILPSLLGEGLGVRCIIEFGFDQREIAEKTLKKYGWEYEFFADYAGIERFCEIKLTNNLFKYYLLLCLLDINNSYGRNFSDTRMIG